MTREIKCDCGWSVRSDKVDELVAKAQEHARDAHNMETTREQLLNMSKPV